MTIALIIVGAIVLIVLYALYASIVRKRNKVAEALAGIDVQLTQRHDLIPNLLAIAKRFMAHETELMTQITQLRAQAAGAVGVTDPGQVAAKFAAEDRLGADLGRLVAVAENYPQMKSDAPMVQAQRGLQEVEANIAAARRFYNSAVGELRNATQVFPGALLAPLAGAGGAPPPFFEASVEARAPVDAAALL